MGTAGGNSIVRVLKSMMVKVSSRAIHTQTSTMGMRRFEVRINECVHYGGFRYGVDEYNPYESYLKDLANGVSVLDARRRFIEFLLYYRPRHIGEALGLAGLSKEYPLWIYPWQQNVGPGVFRLQRGWCSTPDECPDILTHFCDAGILSFRIEEEFVWLERALRSIAKDGYGPCEEGRTYVSVVRLVRLDGREACLLVDGNHRVSAMSALGYRSLKVEEEPGAVVFEKDCDSWYGVRRGVYARDDAMRIFNAYFVGNRDYRTTEEPARIGSALGWKELYR